MDNTDLAPSIAGRKPKVPLLSRVNLRIPFWLRLAISVTLLAALVVELDIAHSLQYLQVARLDILLVAVLVVLLGRCFAAYRWYVLLPTDDPKVSYGRILRFIFISGFLGFLVPGGIGAEAVRIYSLSRVTEDLAMSFSSVLVERLFAVLALASLTLLGLGLLPGGLPSELALMAGVCVAMLVAAASTLMIPGLRTATIAALRGRLLTPVRARLAKLYARLDAYKNRPGLMLWVLLLAFAFQLLRIGEVIVVAGALGIGIEAIYFIVFIPTIILGMLLPISVAGLGVREAGFVYLFGFAGVTQEAAFALGLIWFVVTLSAVPVGAWFYMRQGSR